MPHTLKDFAAVYEEAVQRINVTDLIQMVDMLSWDELGVRMFERAILLTAVCLRQRGVEIRRHDAERPDRTSEASGATRENLSSSENLHKQPFLASWAEPWFWFEKMQQKPDGLFSLTLRHQTHEEELLICYECDGHAKDESHEMRKVAMKMWQAVDAARWTRFGAARRASLPAYTVRSNFKRTRKDKTLPDDVKRALGALYRLMRGHIYAVLLIADDWLASLPEAKQPDAVAEDTLPRQKHMHFDHHIMIGCFTMPQQHHLRMLQISSYRNMQPVHWDPASYGPNAQYLMQPWEFVKYMMVGKNTDHIRDLNDTPLPLIQRAPHSEEPYAFTTNIMEHWDARVHTRTWDSVEVHSLSLQRVQTQSVADWLSMTASLKQRNMSHLHGLWYLTDLHTVLTQHAGFLHHLFNASWGNTVAGHETECRRNMRQQVERAKIGYEASKHVFTDNNPLLDEAQGGHFLFLVHNCIALMEASVLAVLKTNGGFHALPDGSSSGQYMLRWNLNSHIHQTETLSSGGLLTKLKQVMRDHPHRLRERQHTHRTDYWEQYNKSNGTLRAKCYWSLEQNLPQLDEHVQSYLEQFRVPNAALFFRVIRCNSILALRELARQVDTKRMDQPVARHLATLDVCVQSEVNYIFDRVRENLDVYVDTEDVAAAVTGDQAAASSPAKSKSDLYVELARLLLPANTDAGTLYVLIGQAVASENLVLDDVLQNVVQLLFT